MKYKNILIYLAVGVAIVLPAIAGVFIAKEIANRQISAKIENPKLKGPKSAPVRLVAYSDFQCPACSFAAEKAEEFFKEFSPHVSVEFRHYPLKMHPRAVEASLAAECAARQNKFWYYHDRLFHDRAQWAALANPIEVFWRFALEGGIDMKKFEACMVDPGALIAVETDKQAGDAEQVGATPTFFLNGRRLVGGKQFEDQAKAIAVEELEAVGIAVPASALAEKSQPLSGGFSKERLSNNA